MAPTPDLLGCPDGVSAETLSALRDELLPAAEAERLRTHAASCIACRARLAQHDELRRALLAQPELEPGERIVAGVRERLGRRLARRRLALLPGAPRSPLRWSGLGALASAAAVLLLFVYVLGTRLASPLTTRKLTPSGTATMTPVPSPSATATATGPLSPVTNIATAWGANAAVASFLSTLPGTAYYFEPNAVTPDGRYLLGNENLSPAATPGSDVHSAPAGLLDVASKRFTLISAGSPGNPLNCCQTDGRFAVGFDYDQPGATGGVFHRRYWAYDLTTGHLREVALGGTYQGITDAYLSGGVLLLVTGVGVEAANLATGSISTVAGLPETGAIQVMSFTWPYVVYQAQQTSTSAVHIRDLTTGRDLVLHQLERFQGAFSANQGAALVGNTLYYSVGTRTNVNADTASFTTLYQMDSPLDAVSQPRSIATYGGDLGGMMGANGRLVLFRDAAWDRAEERFVAFTQDAAGVPMLLQPTTLADSYFALTAPISLGGPPPQVAMQVTIYDTSRLPVRTGA